MTPETSAKTITAVSWGFLLFAFVWGLAPYTTINAPARLLLDVLDWPPGTATAALDRNTMWLSSIGAGLTVLVSILLLGIVVPAIRAGDRRVIRVTIWAAIGWFVVDGAGSIASGVASNVFFNAFLLAGMLVPLMAVKIKQSPA